MEERIVAFIDILGFSEMILENEKNPTDIPLALKGTLESAFEVLKPNDNDRLDGNETLLQWKKQLQYRTFSDCICISIPTEVNIKEISFLQSCKLFFKYLCNFQTNLLEYGHNYLIRGGVSIGTYYATSEMLFSKALVDAYNLESKHAKVSRILVHQNLIDKIDSEVHSIGYRLSEYPLMTQFEDKLYFLNFLNTFLTDAVSIDEFMRNEFGNDNNLEGNSLKLKDFRIKKYIQLIDNKLGAHAEYTQEVINKYHWLRRFLLSESEKGRSTPYF